MGGGGIKPRFNRGRYNQQTMHSWFALFAAALALPLGGDPGAWDQPAAQQVRIEQHFSIRITPGSPQVPTDMLVELQQEEVPPRFVERKRGKCLPAGSIAAVDSAQGNRLLLFLRDSRIFTGTLDKSCNARDFYSGFYVERNADGQICVNRERLQARTGASCKLKALRELVAVGR